MWDVDQARTKYDQWRWFPVRCITGRFYTKAEAASRAADMNYKEKGLTRGSEQERSRRGKERRKVGKYVITG